MAKGKIHKATKAEMAAKDKANREKNGADYIPPVIA